MHRKPTAADQKMNVGMSMQPQTRAKGPNSKGTRPWTSSIIRQANSVASTMSTPSTAVATTFPNKIADVGTAVEWKIGAKPVLRSRSNASMEKNNSNRLINKVSVFIRPMASVPGVSSNGVSNAPSANSLYRPTAGQ